MNKQSPHEKKGSVLIVALWALFLLTTFAVSLGGVIRQKITLAIRLDARDKLFFIAEAGVKAAVAEARKKDDLSEADCLYETWSSNPAHFQDIPLDKGAFTVGYSYSEEGEVKERYGLMDEAAKININTADAQTLTRLLQKAAGLDEDDALPIAYAIVDWRDSDSFYQHPQHGAEDADYEDLPEPYEAKDSDFEVADELLLVRGITPALFERLQDFITVYGGGDVNMNTAPADILEILGLSQKGIEDLQNFRRGADGQEGTTDDGVFMTAEEIIPKLAGSAALAADDEAVLKKLVERNFLSVKSGYFRVRSLARLGGSNPPTLEIVAVIDRRGSIHSWREYF